MAEFGSFSLSVIQVGAEFSTFQELQDSLTAYQAENFVQLYVRSSRSLQSARKRTPTKQFKDDIVYTEVDYACIHGGRKFVSRSKGDRPNQNTFLKACPFLIQVRTNVQGTALYVKSIHGEHNHVIDQAAFAHLPHQRRLDAATRETAVELMQMTADKKLVQQRILEQSGKIVTIKDLHNIGGKNRPSDKPLRDQLVQQRILEQSEEIVTFKDLHNIDGNNCPSDDIMALLNEMEKTDGATVELIGDVNTTIQGIYFQKQQWRDTYKKYPEILFVDATYKLNNLQMPLYVLLVEDGNGESEIICLWFVCSEDRETISKMTETFKRHNDTRQTNCIMTDKDMTEREVIKEQFPSAKLLICPFHSLRSMKREITTEKMGITSAQRQTVLQILQHIAYSQGEEEYQANLAMLEETHLKRVIVYFDSHWHGIRDQWVGGLRHHVTHYFNRTNNRVESINQKIKSVIGKFSTLATCFRELMQCISSLSLERDHRAVRAFQKRPVQLPTTEDLGQYQAILTPYAFAYVKKQHDLVAAVQPLGVDTTNQACTFNAGGRDLETSILTCSCGIPQSVSLPCRHILALRSELELPLFSPQLYAQRWTRLYFKNASSTVSVDKVVQRTTKILSRDEKHRHARKHTDRLATLASEIPCREFEYAMECLSCFANAWENGQRVVVSVVSSLEAKQSETIQHPTVQTPLSSHNSTATTMPQIPLSSHKNAVTTMPQIPLSSNKSTATTMPQIPLSFHKNAVTTMPQIPLSSNKSTVKTMPQIPLSSNKSTATTMPQIPLSSHKNAVTTMPQIPLSSHKSGVTLMPVTISLSSQKSGATTMLQIPSSSHNSTLMPVKISLSPHKSVATTMPQIPLSSLSNLTSGPMSTSTQGSRSPATAGQPAK